MSERTVAVGFFAFLGLLLIGLALPLLRRKVPPNRWYGFRVPLTLKDPDVWYAVNAWAARWLSMAGVELFVGALLGLLLPAAWLPAYLLALSVLLIVGVLLILVFGVRYARSF